MRENFWKSYEDCVKKNTMLERIFELKKKKKKGIKIWYQILKKKKLK